VRLRIDRAAVCATEQRRLSEMQIRFYLTPLIATLAVEGCSRATRADREAALETVRRNVRLMQERKIDEMMETIHPQSPAFAETRVVMEDLAKKFELKCELTRLDVVGSKRDEMRVRFEQITEMRGEGGMSRTRVAGTHSLRKDDGKWKIIDTKVLRTEMLDTPEEDVTTESPAPPAEVSQAP
jgi:hypothetical protein